MNYNSLRFLNFEIFFGIFLILFPHKILKLNNNNNNNNYYY